MNQYKNHPVYLIASSSLQNEWSCKGLIFEPEHKVTELKRLESAELTFSTKKEAEEHALQLCRTWIDEQAVKT
jgi:hypothetical protein